MINVRLNDQERDALEWWAREEQITVSEALRAFIRSLVRKKKKEEEKES